MRSESARWRRERQGRRLVRGACLFLLPPYLHADNGHAGKTRPVSSPPTLALPPPVVPSLGVLPPQSLAASLAQAPAAAAPSSLHALATATEAMRRWPLRPQLPPAPKAAGPPTQTVAQLLEGNKITAEDREALTRFLSGDRSNAGLTVVRQVVLNEETKANPAGGTYGAGARRGR